MEKPWLKSYPKGITDSLDLNRYGSINELLKITFTRFADRPAFSNMGKTLTFREVDRMSASLASYFTNELKLKPGAKIAIQMPNLLQTPIAIFAALRAGLVVVNTNPLYTAREMEFQFKDSGVEAIVVLANFAANLEEVLPNTSIQHVIVTEVGDLLGFPKSLIVNAAVKYAKKMVPAYSLPNAIPFSLALRQGARSPYLEPTVSPEDLAFLQYTGGTTGVSKGAMLTHANMVANMEQCSAWMGPLFVEGAETMLCPLPLYHIFSLTVNCFTFLRYGGHNILITNPRDMSALIGDMKKYPLTVVVGVNTLFNGLLNHSDFASIDFSKLKLSVGGGMAVQTVVAEKWFKVTGTPLVEGYGLTEASPVLSVNPVDGTHRLGTIGLPMPMTELELRDDDGKKVGPDESGEIWARGPQVMKGYWKRPDETEKVLTSDGWLKTGDIGMMEPDGFFRIVDRKKDMIIVSGFNVYPNEVEDVMAMHPGVLEVACVGIPDEKAGEAVKIFVVRKDPNLTVAELRKHATEKLTGYKIPRHYEFRDELPKTNVGKILRRALRDAPVPSTNTPSTDIPV